MDKRALIDIFEQCNGDTWIKKANWTSNNHIGTWHGVSIDNFNGKVKKLELSNNNIQNLTVSVSKLDQLEV